jgi:hypothetical protein
MSQGAEQFDTTMLRPPGAAELALMVNVSPMTGLGMVALEYEALVTASRAVYVLIVGVFEQSGAVGAEITARRVRWFGALLESDPAE